MFPNQTSSLCALNLHRKPLLPVAVLYALISCFFSNLAYAEQDFSDAKSIMLHIDRLWRSSSSQAQVSMTVKTRRYERTMNMEMWSKGKEKSLIVIRSPKKDRGIATLKVEENIWNYLPKINRVSKVPASMMSGSWMGSHFTNDDLVKENTYEDDFNSEISFRGSRNGKQIVEVTSLPKPDAAVVWGKIVTEIDQSNYTPVRSIYFDEENQKIRTLFFEDVQQKGERTLPMLMRMVPHDKTNEATIVRYHEILFDVTLDERLFSLKGLQKRR